MEFPTYAYQLKNEILLVGYKNGRRFLERIKYKPTLYLPTQETTPYIGAISNEPVAPVEFNSIYEASQFLRENEGEAIYGFSKAVYPFLADRYPGESTWNEDDICTGVIDIEVDSRNGFPDVDLARETITAITLYLSRDKTYHTWALKDYTPEAPDIDYRQFETETAMMQDFVSFWRKNYPDIITGWNSNRFDMPYIINRLCRLFGDKEAKKLSPWGIVNTQTITIQGKPYETYEIVGVSSLDYLDLFKKYTYSAQESYKLDYIAKVVLGEGKVSYNGSLTELYDNDHQKFIRYNIRDTSLVKRIDDAKKFISLVITMTYWAKMAKFNDPFSPVRFWETLIYNHLLVRNTIAPIKSHSQTITKTEKFKGALVKETIDGLHKWVVSFDLTALYPSLMIQFNIGPDTIVNREDLPSEILKGDASPAMLAQHNIIRAANNEFFMRDKQSFIGEVATLYFDRRKIFKNEMLKAEAALEIAERGTDTVLIEKLKADKVKFDGWQNVSKVVVNALYGASGNPYFAYYDIRSAEGVTLSGQMVITRINNALNDYLNRLLKTTDYDYIIASDTDSVILRLEKLIEVIFKDKEIELDKALNFLDRFCKEKLHPVIVKVCNDIYKEFNCFSNRLDMKREVIADRAIWVGKKHYVINVWDSEGVRYDKPKQKIKGVAAVKSSTPEICRTALKDALKIIMAKENDDLIDFVDNFKEKFYNSDITSISFPRSVNDMSAHWKNNAMQKGAPPQVRGSIIYNQMLDSFALGNTYEKIRDGDKIKFVYLKEPNPLNDFVIAFKDDLPTEFNINEYIDFDSMFEKTFLSALTSITDAIGWKTERRYSLSDY